MPGQLSPGQRASTGQLEHKGCGAAVWLSRAGGGRLDNVKDEVQAATFR